jgi:tetratricopeptide (TPR) repeat protein
MGRFSHLEWRGAPGPSRREEPLEPDEPCAAPRDEGYYLAQAALAARGGRLERALRLYSRALEFDPNLAAGWVGQARMLVELGELREAEVWADKGLDLHRDHPELLAAKAQAVARRGDPVRALALNDAAMRGRGAPPEVWLSRGEAILAGGARERGAVERAFEKARVEGRGDPFVSVQAARIYLGYGHAPSALAWAEAAVRKDPKYAYAWRVQGEVESALGLVDLAERSLGAALGIDRDCPGALPLLARVRELPLLERVWLRIRGALSRRRSR